MLAWEHTMQDLPIVLSCPARPHGDTSILQVCQRGGEFKCRHHFWVSGCVREGGGVGDTGLGANKAVETCTHPYVDMQASRIS